MSKNKKANADEKKAIKSRGTQDDLEILKLIILENRDLLTRVLDKIRMHHAESGKDLNAAMKDKKVGAAK